MVVCDFDDLRFFGVGWVFRVCIGCDFCVLWYLGGLVHVEVFVWDLCGFCFDFRFLGGFGFSCLGISEIGNFGCFGDSVVLARVLIVGFVIDGFVKFDVLR